MKHTPEPWFVGAQNDAPFIINQPPRPSTDDIVDVPGVVVIGKLVEIDGDAMTSVANARRAVACVNALAGLNPEAVKDALWALEQIITDLPANRDWLDPDVEKVARDALAKLKAPTP